MCTSMAMKTSGFYFGRNMDIDYGFGEQVVIAPRNYPFQFRKAGCGSRHSAIIGMAAIKENYPLYAEAMNEQGLCMAGLNFPYNAYYPDYTENEKYNISPFELIPWILGSCRNLIEAKRLLSETHIIAVPFSENLPLTPLHWHIADKSGSIVVESMKDGMHVYENPVNVLTNNPPFEFQMYNLAQYLNLHTGVPENCFSEKGILPFGKGLGSYGLPGDFSPASRFVKTAYLLLNSVCDTDENSSVSQFFHILDSVSVVSGGILPNSTSRYLTTYSCCMNADRGVYYYKTYSNNRISAVNMKKENLHSQKLITFEVDRKQSVASVN